MRCSWCKRPGPFHRLGCPDFPCLPDSVSERFASEFRAGQEAFDRSHQKRPPKGASRAFKLGWRDAAGYDKD